MAKKRKAGGRPYGQEVPRVFDERDSKLRINTFEDVADSEDEFYINRDKVLLDESPAQKKQRKFEEEGKYRDALLVLAAAKQKCCRRVSQSI